MIPSKRRPRSCSRRPRKTRPLILFIVLDRESIRFAEPFCFGDLSLSLAGATLIERRHGVAPSLDCDIVFADPPYDFDAWDRLLDLVKADLVVAESGRSITCPDGWEITREKKYGRTVVTFLERTQK